MKSDEEGTDFDVAVIGGGINGTGVAREAAYRGYRTLLLEKDDFGQATSGQSTKMIHGGIRYLETGDFHLVYESLRERATLLRTAPNLVKPIRLVIPIYQNSPRSGWMVRLGTMLYDLLAGWRNMKRSRRLSRSELEALPGLRKEGLRWAVAYSDGQVQDSRLCLETALSARVAGASIRNYHEVTGAKEGPHGFELSGIDHRSGQPFCYSARAVVNASGPWCPFLEQRTLQHQTKPMVYDRGIHIVVPSLGLDCGLALMLNDGRLLFVLPWQENYTLIGTTESSFQGNDFTQVPISEEEVDYLLGHTNHFFPDRGLTRADVVHYYSGVRTLVAGQELAMTKLSREADIRMFSNHPGTAWMILYGGKLTSYRALAEKTLNKLADQIPPPLGKNCQKTSLTSLYGGDSIPPFSSLPNTVSTDQATAWQRRYGSRWEALESLVRKKPTLAEPLVPRFQFTRADLVYMVTKELAFRLEDITQRRTKMAYALTDTERKRLMAALESEVGQLPQFEPTNCA